MTVKSSGDIHKLGTILGIWAHPDDESFTCGGILAAAVQNGQRVACVTATKGEAGVQDAKRWPPERLAEIRTAELQAALKVLGISEHYWLGYRDGQCNKAGTQEATSKISKIIDEVRPDTILTFGPEGLTGHPDHQTVSKWADLAVKNSGRATNIYHAVTLRQVYEANLQEADRVLNFFFNINEPVMKEADECDIFLDLSPWQKATKMQALKVMPSQTESLFNYLGDEGFELCFGKEAFVKAP